MRLTRFGTNYNGAITGANEEQTARVAVLTPTRGLHQGDSALDLEPGYSPELYNFVIDAGKLTPRSGITAYKGGVSGVSDALAGAWRMNDHTGLQFLVAASTHSVVVYDPVADAWSALSYQRPSAFASDEVPSASSREFWDGTWVYDAASDRNIGVLTNFDGLPLELTLGGSIATFSNVTDFRSLASRARAVCNADDRLVWWNVATSSNSYPTRVMWSARGSPKNYSVAAGAGFEDLLDVSGVGTRVVAEREGILLFTDEEIWRGRIRRDAYVFDFYPIEKHFGAPYARTIVSTPLGCMFLGNDLEVYVVRGDEVMAVGPAQQGEASRVASWLNDEVVNPERCWAVYNPTERRYELYYVGTDSANGYASRALFYAINEASFLPQRLGVELSAGTDYLDAGDPLMWTETDATWEEVATAWEDQLVAGVGKNIYAFTSDGTGVRFYDAVTDDMGATINTLWTSHSLSGADPTHRMMLTEAWLDVEAPSSSTMTVEFANASSNVSRAVALSGTHRVHVPGLLNGMSPSIRLRGTGGNYRIARLHARLVDAGVVR